jgi:hypothetical protein
MLLEVNFFITKQDKASKDTLFQSNRSLNISHQKLKNVTQGGGGQKVHKKCHVLFEWPLKENLKNYGRLIPFRETARSIWKKTLILIRCYGNEYSWLLNLVLNQYQD